MAYGPPSLLLYYYFLLPSAISKATSVEREGKEGNLSLIITEEKAISTLSLYLSERGNKEEKEERRGGSKL